MYVAVTGGIGSGKSTFADLLGELGAQVIHADDLARQALSPGSPLLPALFAHFGQRIRTNDGSVDRQELARIVFSDPDELRQLETLTHPEVSRLAREIREQCSVDTIVVYDVPLLVEKGMADQFDAVIVVVAPEQLRLDRLVQRGLDIDDARARMMVQATDDQRMAVADYIVDNSQGLQELKNQAQQVFDALQSRMR